MMYVRNVLFLGVLGLLIVASPTAQAQSASVTIPDGEGDAGDVIYLTVDAELIDIVGYSLTFSYDSDVMVVSDVSEGSDVSFPLFTVNDNSVDDGELTVGGTGLTEGQSVSGEFLIFEISLLADGSTSFAVSGEFSGTSDTTIPVSDNSGTITVGDPLPVELTSFDAARDGEDVLLRWSTASETNNSGFEVQRKAARSDAEAGTADWQFVTFVEGHGTSLEAHDYSHRVEGLAPGRHVFRLEQIDYDGTSAYSPEVEVRVEVEDAFLLTPAHPNPFRDQTRFSLSVAERQQVEVAVFDVTGRRVAQIFEGSISEGQRTMTWASTGLPSGLYVIRTTGETFSNSQKVTLLK